MVHDAAARGGRPVFRHIAAYRGDFWRVVGAGDGDGDRVRVAVVVRAGVVGRLYLVFKHERLALTEEVKGLAAGVKCPVDGAGV